LHGLFEGRELGKEKAFEIWEELGYYEGWAGLFMENLKSTGKEGRYVKLSLLSSQRTKADVVEL
jgi:hypothetical protein